MSEEAIAYTLLYNGKQRRDVLSYTVVNGVTKGLNYHFKIRAINAVGYSEFSEPLIVYAAIVPSVPLNFNVTGSDTSSVSLSWEPPRYDGGAALTGYYIYYKIYGSLASWSKTSLISTESFADTISTLTAD